MNSERPLEPANQRFRLRPDLQWTKYSDAELPTWVARNPVSLEYFYFSDFEKRLLSLLNGTRTVRDVLQHEWTAKTGPAWVLNLIGKAQSANLLIPVDGPGSGAALWQAKLRARQRSRIQWLLSPLAIRIKLLDPTRLLELMTPLANVLFSRTLAFISILILPVVIYFVLIQIVSGDRGTLIDDAFGQMNSERLLMLLVVYLGIKSLHELGHALACRKWKAECHEIGLFFLVFAPCLYCDTTDSWKLDSRWRRAAIAGAGIYVEVLIATLAGVLWLVTQTSSWLHWVAAYAMAIGSFSTIVVNANPLLRYDGYYILSDLWRVPNLADQSREALRAAMIRLLNGTPIPKDRWDAGLGGLIVYQIAAKCYRTFLLAMILTVVWLTLDRWGLRLVAILLIAMTITTALMGSLWGTVSLLKEMKMSGGIIRWRAIGLLVAVGLLLWMALSVPMPTYVSSRAITALRDMRPLYARQTGKLVEFSPLGKLMPESSLLVKLQSSELEMEHLMIEGTIAQLQEKLVQLRLSQVDDDQAALELGNTVEQIAMYQARRKILGDEIASLQIFSEFEGRLIPGLSRPQLLMAESDHLGIWNPILSTAHLEATVERGTLLGWLAGGNEIELTAIVTEQEAERIRPGMQVVCRWDCLVGTIYQGVVKRIAADPLEKPPEILMGDPSLGTGAESGSQIAGRSGFYEVLISVPDFPDAAVHQSLATVHIATAPSTLWEMIYRFYSINIRPQLIRQSRLAMNSSNIGSAIVSAVLWLSDSVNTWSNCP